MQKQAILLAESGSTKTDWCYIKGKTKKHFKTQGINPYFLSQSEIITILEQELPWNIDKQPIDKLIYYGSGIANSDKKSVLTKCLRYHFGVRNSIVESDMLAAALATCGKQKGITVILGTGSNSCYFDGKKIAASQISLGFALGDEGGGNHIGRKVLQYYFYNIFEADIKKAFDKYFNLSKDEILEGIYRKPFPNRYLAQFAKFCFEHKQNYHMQNIMEDCINDFFINHLLQYKQLQQVPIHFVGSVSHECAAVIEQLCAQYELKLGTILKSPMQGLIKYYTN
jgi:glucosamine kinase